VSRDNLDKTVSKDDLSLFGPVSLVGQTIAGRWDVVELIGEGNMSTVYRAEEQSTRKVIALKFIHRNITASVINPKRLEQQAKSLIALNHEHISNFYDIYLSPGHEVFLFCDYLPCETLEEVLSKCGHITFERAVNIFAQACDGIAYAHKQKILHRDIKPSNICLINDQFNADEVKVVDFGIMRLILDESEETKSSQYITHTREIFGSVLYMSPEQCAGKKLDARSDIYSLGCVMYEAINGKPPFVGKNVMETAYKHMNDTPAPLNAPPANSQLFERYQAVVMRTLRKDPDDRYQSMANLRSDLEILMRASESDWQGNSFATRRAKILTGRKLIASRFPWGLVASIIFGCLLLGMLAIWIVSLLGETDLEDYAKFDNNLLWVESNSKAKNLPDDFSVQRSDMLESLDIVANSKTKFSKEYAEKLHDLCTLYFKAGQYGDALEKLKELIDLQNKLPDTGSIAESDARLAVCYFWQSEFDQAAATSLDTLKYCKRTNKQELWAEAKALSILGDVYTRKGDHEKAKETYLKLYGFCDHLKLKMPGDFAHTSAMLADAYRRLGKFPEAQEYYRNSMDWWQNYVSHQDIVLAKMLYGLGLVLEGEHRYKDAQERFKRAMPLAINAAGVRSPLVGAIKKETSECLFHTDFWLWLKQKIKPEEDAQKTEELPPLRLP
jgi:serine/threonine protein kinase